MDSDAQIENYATFSEWLIAHLRIDLAPFHPVVPADQAANLAADLAGLSGLAPEAFQQAEADYHQFFCTLLDDMAHNPAAYGLPQEAFLPFLPEYSQPASQAVKQQADCIRARRLKARKAVNSGLDFVYQLGLIGTLDGWELRVDKNALQALVEEKRRVSKLKSFLPAFERCGFAFTDLDGAARVANTKFPHMLPALAGFSRECARNKDFGQYFFRRCDFRLFVGANQPGFDDALRLVPGVVQPGVDETDRLLARLKFKREVMVGAAGEGYRVRYSKKGGQRVYWCRIRTPDLPVFYHHLRWDLGGEVTPRLFERLEARQPGLSERVFAGIKWCLGCYENCQARAQVAWEGQPVACCTEVGWEVGAEDFGTLQTVLNVLEEIGG